MRGNILVTKLDINGLFKHFFALEIYQEYNLVGKSDKHESTKMAYFRGFFFFMWKI